MSGLPQSYGVAFPTQGGGNAYPPSASSYAAAGPPQQQQQVQIQPGAITYTTSTLPDGRVQYNQFRAEARSYQTPQGPVHGIQWIPIQVSYDLPSNAHPAGPDFHASWTRPGGDKESQKMLKEWQRDQEKRARKEEKESAKRMKEWERDRREREKAEEKEIRRIQERDMVRERGRERKLSNAGLGSEYGQYSSASAAFPRARSRSRVRRDSAGQDEITRAMAEMAMEKDWGTTDGESRYGGRERRGSNVGRPRGVSFNGRPGVIPVGEYERTRKTSGTPYPTAGYATGAYPSYGDPAAGLGPGAYADRAPSPRRGTFSDRAPSPRRGTFSDRAPSPRRGTFSDRAPSPRRGAFSDRAPSPRRGTFSDRAPSPYMGGGGLPVAGGGPVYPPGHIYAGRPIPGMQGDSLGSVGGGYGPPSPRRTPLQLDSPAGFSRPPSLAVPYTYFDPLMIIADMNELFQHLPLMPAVLGPHDVWIEDWIRCLEDLARAWTGKMPVKERNRIFKNHTVVAQLIDVWNASFFSLRGVELVLYRGRQRRSGPQAGRYDTRLGFEPDSDDESDTISSVSSDSDVEDRYAFYGGARHIAGGNHWLADSREARRLRKAEKRVHEKQKRKRRERERQKEGGSGFSLYLTCTNEGQPRLPPTSGYPSATSGYPSGYPG